MTPQPRTAVGRALLMFDWERNIGQLRDAILAIEAEAAAPLIDERLQCGKCGDWLLLSEIEGHLNSEGRTLAAATPAEIDEERLARALRAFVEALPLTYAVGGYRNGPGRIVPSINEAMAPAIAAAYSAEREGEKP